MSITVSCECGKQFTVADHLAGKRGKCKACGRVLTVPTAEVPLADEPDLDLVAAAPEPPRKLQPRPASQFYVPSSRPANSVAKAPSGRAPVLPASASAFSPKREKPQSAMRSIPMPPPVITFLTIAAAIVGLTVYWAENGPVKATHHWEQIEPTARTNFPQEITRSIRWVYAQHGVLTRFPNGLGQCKSIYFDAPVLMFSLPNDMHMWGETTEGHWTGEFYTKTGKYEISLQIAGASHKLTGQYDSFDMDVDGTRVVDSLMTPPPSRNDY